MVSKEMRPPSTAGLYLLSAGVLLRRHGGEMNQVRPSLINSGSTDLVRTLV